MALQSLESNPQLSFATRREDWTCLGQHKRHPEFPVVPRESRRNSRKTTWLPRLRKMKPFPSTAPQEKSHVRNWKSKGHLAPLMRPTKFPEIPVSLERAQRRGCRKTSVFLSRGDRDLGVAFQTHPGRPAFISSGSKEPRSALESRRVSLEAHWVDSRESSLLRRLERGREIGL